MSYRLEQYVDAEASCAAHQAANLVGKGIAPINKKQKFVVLNSFLFALKQFAKVDKRLVLHRKCIPVSVRISQLKGWNPPVRAKAADMSDPCPSSNPQPRRLIQFLTVFIRFSSSRSFVIKWVISHRDWARSSCQCVSDVDPGFEELIHINQSRLRVCVLLTRLCVQTGLYRWSWWDICGKGDRFNFSHVCSIVEEMGRLTCMWGCWWWSQ